MRFRVLIVLIAASLVAACMSRRVVEAPSPDGTLRAEVRDTRCLDGPCQSIWVGPSNRLRKVQDLAEDQDWCNTIVWSGDSSTAVFLVQDAKLVAVDANTARVIASTWAIDRSGAYPPAQHIVDLALSDDGRLATFRVCARNARNVECRRDQRILRPAV